VLDRFPDFSTLIAAPPGIREFEALRRAETTGRPLGPPIWVERLAVPTIILYEVSIWAARFVEKKRDEEKLAAEKEEAGTTAAT
jgi:hypothetical protein